MSVVSGLYRVYTQFGDSELYPQIMIVYVGDYINQNTSSISIVDRTGVITTEGADLLSNVNISGFFDVWTNGYTPTLAPPEIITPKAEKIVNYAGVAGMSLSPPSQYTINGSSVQFSMYLDEEKTRELVANNISASNNSTLPSYWKYSTTAGLEAYIPLIRISSDETELMFGYIRARSSGSTTTSDPGNVTVSLLVNPSNRISLLPLFDGISPIDFGSPDPYEPGGSSGHGGGTGTFSRTGDNIGIPALPTLSAVDTGLISLYVPSIGQMNSLATYLWSGAFDIETFKKIMANPADALLGLAIVPVNVPTGGSSSVKVGNIDTGVSMPKASTQYVEVDCGSLNVQEYWGSYLDYAPYTKCYIYLPYCGTHPIDADEIMNKSVRVVYHVDVLSGSCMAFVQCGGTVIYNFAGQCTCSIPITSRDLSNVVNGALGIAGSIGSMVAGVASNAAMGNIPGAIGAAAGGLASIGQNVMSMKQNVEKSGALGGMGGMLGVQTPYLIITWPNQAVPRNQNKEIGYPSLINTQLSELIGYTEVQNVHLYGIPASDVELEEIEQLIKNGVIV